MVKVVINTCHGGFGLSEEAVIEYFKIKRQPLWITRGKYNSTTYWVVPEYERVKEDDKAFYEMTLEERQEYNRKYDEQTFCYYNLRRDDLTLLQVVENLQEKANGKYAELKIIEIPDDVDWYIEEYDGAEWVAEKHRTWS